MRVRCDILQLSATALLWYEGDVESNKVGAPIRVRGHYDVPNQRMIVEPSPAWMELSRFQRCRMRKSISSFIRFARKLHNDRNKPYTIRDTRHRRIRSEI